MGKRKGRRRCTSGEHKPLRVRLIVEEIDEVRAPVPGISRFGEWRDGSRGEPQACVVCEEGKVYQWLLKSGGCRAF